MNLMDYLLHLKFWFSVFPTPSIHSHLWTRVAIDGEPYTCLVCGKEISEEELDKYDGNND